MQSVVVGTGWFVQRLMFACVAILGLGALAYTLAAAFGYAPWLEMAMSFDGTPVQNAGMAVQIGVTALLVGLCVFLPANARIMALETSHRKFHITMDDVARAYRLSHASDRHGVFKLKSEFDSVRERMAYLRDHPDLAELEPSVLEIASQMSHVSRDLAQTYSEASINRARDFLIQRQQEIEDFTTRLDEAKAVAADMRVWVDKVELEESVAKAQLAQLTEVLADILPELQTGVIGTPPCAETVAPAANDTPAADIWDEPVEFPHNDDNRIVALLARRAAE
ncbi:DNA repair protein [Marivita sp. S0852]|uniref:DNA repair protein n=1 Tax=Marivita sp. S0852 TaxID=3373893 RepID=UPI003982CC9A